MVDFAMDVFRQLYDDKEVPKELKDKRVSVVAELKSLQSAVVPITTILEDSHVTEQIQNSRDGPQLLTRIPRCPLQLCQISIRMRQLFGRSRIPLLSQSFGPSERQKLHERPMGEARLGNLNAKLGYRFGRCESDQRDHRLWRYGRRNEFRRNGQSLASASAKSVAHPLVPLRFLQPSEGQRSHHRSLSVPATILEHDSNGLPTHSALFDDGRHHQQEKEKRHQRPRQSHPTGVIHIQGPHHGIHRVSVRLLRL